MGRLVRVTCTVHLMSTLRPDHPKKEIRVRRLLFYILCLNPTKNQIFRNAKVCAKKAFYTVHSARATYSLTPMGHTDSNGPIVSNKSDLSIFDFLIFYWFK